jgi:ClpP class serine protease
MARSAGSSMASRAPTSGATPRRPVRQGDDARGFKHVEMSTYVARLREEAPQRADKIGVVVAQGAIVDGEQPPGVWAAIRWPP